MSKKKEIIVSFDIGRKDLAVCVYNAKTRRGLFWKNFDTNLDTFNSNTWKDTISKILMQIPKGDIYLIEKQVTFPENHKNLLLEMTVNCIVTFFFGKRPIIVDPKTISKYFSMTKKKYYKKKDAVAICEQIIKDPRVDIRFEDSSLPKLFISEKGIKKRDDLADCFLQAIYYAETKLYPRTEFDPSKYKNYLQVKSTRKRKITNIDLTKKTKKSKK